MGTTTENYSYDAAQGLAWLRSKDPKLGRLMERVGPYRLELRNKGTLFQALLHSIVYQQLSGKAAQTIHSRLLDLFPNRYPNPTRMLALPDAVLAAAGLSRAKLNAVKDLAEHCFSGSLAHTRTLKNMDDGEVIEHLLKVRGVGVWTAQMLLIFYLGRPDVLPAGDLGVVKGFRIAYGLAANPEPQHLLDHGERWRPFRSIASWYLWQANRL